MKTLLLGAILLGVISASAQVVKPVSGHKIMIFGGDDHKVYLGCLSCSKFAADAVVNSFGQHGSKFQSASIFNSFGQFGGKFNDTSACNQFAIHPPVIVDERGNYYGELTVNEFRPERTKSQVLQSWLAGVCQNQ